MHARRLVAFGLIAAAVALGVAGCSTDEPTAPLPSPAQPSVGLPSMGLPSMGLPSSLPPGPSESPAAQPRLSVKTINVMGTEGSLAWHVLIPSFSGSDAVGEINRRVRASADAGIAVAKEEAKQDQGEQRTLSGESTVTTNDGRTVQVVIDFTDTLAGTAHPLYSVNTTVVTAEAGDPLLLSDVFTDLRAAYPILAREVRKAAKADGTPVSDPSGLAPKKANWSAWQSTADGLEFHFQDYQLGGHGRRSYTVPWSAVDDLLTDEARQLLLP